MVSKNQYQIGQSDPYPISRSKLDDFVKCPRCFVLDRREWTKPPSGPSFTLNSAVDGLLKLEFDQHRADQTVHPVVAGLGFGFLPAQFEQIDDWRNNRKGVQFLHEASNLKLSGAIDDLWFDPENKTLHVVDYKTTARNEPVAELGHEDYHDAYRRQIDFYQWLLLQNGIEVSTVGYWLYATARKSAEGFDGKLVFDFTLIEHQGQHDWIEPALLALRAGLDQEDLVDPSESCKMCKYTEKRGEIERA